MAREYAQISVFGHYLFRCWGDNVRGQISVDVFAPKRLFNIAVNTTLSLRDLEKTDQRGPLAAFH